MAIKSEEVRSHSIEVLGEGRKHIGNIFTAYEQGKWWRLIALIILAMVMMAVVLFAKPLLAAYFLKWFVGTWGLSLPVSKVVASCVAKCVVTQLGNLLKYWVLKIDK
jgi:uncharacterized membrane protein HdeD (DUF308 family)